MRLRNRMVKAEYWTDTRLISTVNLEGRLFFLGLIQLAEDSGVVEFDPLAWKIHLFPCDPKVTGATLQTIAEKLIAAQFLIPFDAENKRLIFVRNFHRHQSLRSPGRPNLPLPEWIEWVPSKQERRSGEYKVDYEIMKSKEIHRTVTVASPLGDQVEVELEVETEGELNPLPPLTTVRSPYGHDAGPMPQKEKSENKSAARKRGLTPAEKEPPGFVSFWKFYSANFRGDAKAEALKVWTRDHLEDRTAEILDNLLWRSWDESWTRESGKFSPHARTYLSQRRYADPIPKWAEERLTFEKRQAQRKNQPRPEDEE